MEVLQLFVSPSPPPETLFYNLSLFQESVHLYCRVKKFPKMLYFFSLCVVGTCTVLCIQSRPLPLSHTSARGGTIVGRHSWRPLSVLPNTTICTSTREQNLAYTAVVEAQGQSICQRVGD